MNFKIHTNTNTLSIKNVISNSEIFSKKFDLMEYTSLYKDNFIEIIWNPLYQQPQFKLFSNNGNYIRGSHKILNSNQSEDIITFQFLTENNVEYYFSTDGTEENLSNNHIFIENWNKAKIWLSSVFDINFPYYSIKISSSSNLGFIKVTYIN